MEDQINNVPENNEIEENDRQESFLESLDPDQEPDPDRLTPTDDLEETL